MKIRSKTRKQAPYCCCPGSRCSLSTAVWGLVGCVLILHLYSLVHHRDGVGEESELRLNHFSLVRELEEIEEESFRIPPPRRRSPRAAKRRPKRPTTIIEEFLDENSQIRHLFFPDEKTAINPRKEAGNDSFYFYPGRIWLDTDGNPIQAHGGGILYVERTRMYYWYGENKEGPTYHAYDKGPARVSWKIKLVGF